MNYLKRKFLCMHALLFVTLLCFSHGAFAQSESNGEGGVNAETIKLRIEAVEGSTSLDEQVAASLIDLYRRSLVNIDRERLEKQAALEFEQDGKQSRDELLQVQRDISELRSSLEENPPAVSAKTGKDQLEESLAKARSELDAAEAKQTKLRDLYNVELGRPGKARDRLAEARTERESASMESPAATGNIPELIEAQGIYRESRVRSLNAEIRKLEQELLTHEQRVTMLAAQLELTGLEVSSARYRTRAIEDAISARSGAAAEQARADALAARQELEGRHPVIAELAGGNVELGNYLNRQVEHIQQVSDERDATQQQMAKLNEELSSTRAKLAIAGLNQALGQLLLDQRRALPNARTLKKRIRERERLAADIGLKQIEFGEQLRKLREGDRGLDSLAQQLADEDIEGLSDELDRLTRDRVDLLERSMDGGIRYLRILGELDLAERQLADAVVEYSKYLDIQLMWVRNTPPVDSNALQSLPSDLARFADKGNWAQFRQDLLSNVRERPWIFTLGGLLLLLGLARSRFLARVDAYAGKVGKIRTDRFGYSVLALLYTVMAAAPIPLALYLTGSAMASGTSSDSFTVAISASIARASANFLLIQLFFDLARDRGVMLKHCDWPEFSVQKLRQEFSWFRWVYPGSMLITEANFILDYRGALGTLTLLGSVATSVGIAILAYRLFSPEGGILRDFLRARPGRLVTQTRPIWMGLLALALPALILLWLSGFSYTSDVLLTSFTYSFFMVLGVMVVHGLLTRWLTLGARRLEYRAALERRDALRALSAAGQEPTGSDESDFDFEEPRVDYASLDSNSRLLVKTVTLFFTLFWLWVIWSPVVPALTVLEEISFWSRTALVNGNETQVPVTLVDLIRAVIITVVTISAAKGLPSLIEIAILHRFQMTTGGRYTATTLMRYAIIGIGGATVIGMLGVSWNKAQWLVAALGVGIGFGLQEIVANFISGLVLLFERPIRIGDVVTVGETSGVVTRIQIRATTIRDWDRRELLVPNKEFITTRLLNWSLSDEVIRLLIPVGVAYGSDVMKAMKLAEEAAREHPEVLKDPAPFVIFEGFGDNALNLSLRAYLPSVENRLGSMSDINQAINRKFKEAGIVIAFPQRDIHLETAGPIDVRLHPADGKT